MVEPAYRYSATVVKWVDGDTVDVQLDLGFDITVATRIRLYGVDTPEKTVPAQKAAAVAAWERSRQLAPEGSVVVVSTFKAKEKYGRYLGVVHVDGGRDVGDVLLLEGLARAYFGGSKQ
jgi:micrococcal nuclease